MKYLAKKGHERKPQVVYLSQKCSSIQAQSLPTLADILCIELPLIFWKVLEPGQWPHECFSMYFLLFQKHQCLTIILPVKGYIFFFSFLKTIIKEESCVFKD